MPAAGAWPEADIPALTTTKVPALIPLPWNVADRMN
jgi:hypothetical protein